MKDLADISKSSS